MDYLNRCYRATIRPYRDSEETVEIRWFYCAPGAKVFPGTHVFGSQVWREVADIPPDGPGELFGTKPIDRGFNPGYLGLCHQGPDEWFSEGAPRSAADGLPSSLPPCCFQPPTGHLGLGGGWAALCVSRGGQAFGNRGGFWSEMRSSSLPLGDRGGWLSYGRTSQAGALGNRGGWIGSAALAYLGGVGLLGGWAGVAAGYSAGGFGTRGGWYQPPPAALPQAWGGLGGWLGLSQALENGALGGLGGWRAGNSLTAGGGLGGLGGWRGTWTTGGPGVALNPAWLGNRGGWVQPPPPPPPARWGGLGGWQGDNNTTAGGNLGGRGSFTGQVGAGQVGNLGLLGGVNDVARTYFTSLSRVAPYTTPYNVDTPFPFDTADTNGGCWASTAPTRLTAVVAGVWMLCHGALVNALATGSYILIGIHKNGTIIKTVAAVESTGGAGAYGEPVIFTANLAAGDYLEVSYLTTATGGLPWQVGANYRPWATFQMIGQP